MRAYKAIAALSKNRAIGAGGRIPWHVPDDFRWFKQTTMGAILVMGRKTFESIGRPLPGRDTIVLSRTGYSHPGVRTVGGLPELQQFTLDDPRPVWVCGGEEIYRLLLPVCDEVLLSQIHLIADGDAFFPEIAADFEYADELHRTADFHVELYRRRPGLKSGTP